MAGGLMGDGSARKSYLSWQRICFIFSLSLLQLHGHCQAGLFVWHLMDEFSSTKICHFKIMETIMNDCFCTIV